MGHRFTIAPFCFMPDLVGFKNLLGLERVFKLLRLRLGSCRHEPKLNIKVILKTISNIKIHKIKFGR